MRSKWEHIENPILKKPQTGSQTVKILVTFRENTLPLFSEKIPSKQTYKFRRNNN